MDPTTVMRSAAVRSSNTMDVSEFQSRLGKTIAGRYVLQRLLGYGGMGAVYAAEHEVTRHRVAIKVLHPALGCSSTSVMRLLREARLANSIGHPDIVTAYDAGVDGSLAYIVFQLVEGESVATLLEREPRLPVERAIDIALRMLDILAVAHSRGVVHRDVKPSNIFITQDPDHAAPRYMLLDFGVAKVIEANDEPGEHTLTATGAVIGSGHYVSPEQVRGDKDVDHRADLWAVGVLLHRLVTGAHPFESSNFNLLFMAILTATPTSLAEAAPWAPPALCALVSRALQKDRERRPQSAAEMREALRTVLEAPATSPTRTREPAHTIRGDELTDPALFLVPEVTSPPPRTLRRAIVGVALGLTALAAGLWRLHPSRRPDPPPVLVRSVTRLERPELARPAASCLAPATDGGVVVARTAPPRTAHSVGQPSSTRSTRAEVARVPRTARVPGQDAAPGISAANPPPALAPSWHGPGPRPVPDINGM